MSTKSAAGRRSCDHVEVSDWLALILVALGIPAWLMLGVWIARDADRHGAHGGTVGAAFVLLWPLGVLLWLHARSTGHHEDRHRHL